MPVSDVFCTRFIDTRALVKLLINKIFFTLPTHTHFYTQLTDFDSTLNHNNDNHGFCIREISWWVWNNHVLDWHMRRVFMLSRPRG